MSEDHTAVRGPRTGAKTAMSLGRVSIERGTSEARSELAVGAKSEVAL
jgi:hypothetical protein